MNKNKTTYLCLGQSNKCDLATRIKQLKTVAELKEKGLITEEEYLFAKQTILNLLKEEEKDENIQEKKLLLG
jgi:hypothetical protein